MSQASGSSVALPNELIRLYNTRLPLSAAEVSAHLGLASVRMLQHWEGGYRLPPAHRLQALIALYLRYKAFDLDNAEAEARQLWQTVKAQYDATNQTHKTYPLFDPRWWHGLLLHLVVPIPGTPVGVR